MLNVCIDVDLTLVDEEGELLPGVVEALVTLLEVPCELTLWSAAGAEYAKSIAARHMLEDLFVGFAGKPDLVIDDDPQSLVIRRTLVKRSNDHWSEIQKQAVIALKQIREEP